jgi:hypothetical protein
VLANNPTLTGSDEVKPLWLANFIEVYQDLSVDNLANLKAIYHQEVVFQDPLHQLNGFNALADYFAELYQNVFACRFVIKHIIQQGNQAAIYWTMTYQHPKLRGGRTIEVEGHSLIKGQDNKVIYHRDYLDVGQMLYEHIPVLGRVISWLKKRVSQ